MSQCDASCLPPQTGGKRNTLQGGKRSTRKKRVRFTRYVNVYNHKTCKRRRHHKTHKKLPKNCANAMRMHATKIKK